MDQTVQRVVVPAQAPAERADSTPTAASPGTTPAARPVAPVLRTPVFGEDLALAGYHLAVPGAPPASAGDDGADDVVMEALAAALEAVPTELLAGGGVLFVPVPAGALAGTTPWPPSLVEAAADTRVVLSVDEADLSAPAAVDGLRTLAGEGLRLCLVGSAWSPALRPLLPLFGLARADVARVGSVGLVALAGRLREFGIGLSVSGVETLTQLEAARRVGARFLTGGLVERPPVVAERGLAPSQLACLRLATALVRPDVDMTEVELAVRSDPALTMRVLRSVNSAGGGARHRVSSIRQAVVLLGPRALLGCVLSAGLSQTGAACPPEAVESVLVRARMCELLATTGLVGRPLDGSSAFTVGLVSGLDVLLGADLVDILAELPVDEAVENAVLAHTGPLGAVLADVLAYAEGAAPQLLDVAGVRGLYLAALAWAGPLVGSPG